MDVEAITASLFAAAERGDWDEFRSKFADDAVLRKNVGTEESIDEAMSTLSRFTERGRSLRYENVRRVVGERSVTEMHDGVFTKPDGAEVRIDLCVVIQFNHDGLIVRTDEYLDSAAAAALFR